MAIGRAAEDGLCFRRYTGAGLGLAPLADADMRSPLVTLLAAASGFHPAALAAPVQHYEYVITAGFITVYDIDNHFALVKTVPVPTTAGPRGSVASALTGMLYISFGPDWTDGGGSLLKYNLRTDQVEWIKTYRFGIDSMALSPDGSTIFMPTGEIADSSVWQVIDAESGEVTGFIDSTGHGPHNTVVNSTGTHVYLGPRDTNYLIQADAVTHQVLQSIGPIATAPGTAGVRPFTINGAETYAFIVATGLLGFQVGDIKSGKILYKVPINGFTWGSTGTTAPSHGISLSPDEREIYVIDSPNSYVHVFDVTGLPDRAPRQVADLPLTNKMTGSEVGCAYDCGRHGWLHHSRDGRYVFVQDSGDVIDTQTRKTVATLPAMANTRHAIEIDFQNGVPVWAMQNKSSIGTLRATPPGGVTLLQRNAVSGSRVAQLTANFKSSNASGSLLIAFVRMSTTTQSVSITDSTGNVYQRASSQVQNAGGYQVHLFYATNAAAGPNTVRATFSAANDEPSLAIYEYSGAGFLDQAVSAQGSGSFVVTDALKTSHANELVFVGAGFPSGFTAPPTAVQPFTIDPINIDPITSDPASASAATEATVAAPSGAIYRGALTLPEATNWAAVAAAFATQPQPGGIRLEQSTATEATGVASVSAQFPAPNKPGNLILAFVRMSTADQTVQIHDTAGNSYAQAVSQVQSADGHQTYLFYARNIVGGPNTITAQFSASNNHPWIAVYEYTGLDPIRPLDVTAAAQGVGSVASTGPSLGTRVRDELVFVGVGLPASFSGSAAAASPYTIVQRNFEGSPAANAAAVVSIGGSLTGAMTLSADANWTAILATFAAADHPNARREPLRGPAR